MATAAPLMPKATAVWLVDNTALSFDQIAEFCKLHPLEVKAIADGDAAQGIKGLDPIQTGQLTREQITAGRGRSRHPPDADRAEGRGSAARARRQEGPALHAGVAPPGPAERHPVAGAQSSRTQGQRRSCGWSAPPSRRSRRSATAPTGTRPALAPMDPVTLGLCSQIDLDFEVNRANKEKPAPADTGATLLPAAETTARKEAEVAAAAAEAEQQAGRQRSRRRRRVRQAQAARRQGREGRRRVSRALSVSLRASARASDDAWPSYRRLVSPDRSRDRIAGSPALRGDERRTCCTAINIPASPRSPPT